MGSHCQPAYLSPRCLMCVYRLSDCQLRCPLIVFFAVLQSCAITVVLAAFFNVVEAVRHYKSFPAVFATAVILVKGARFLL